MAEIHYNDIGTVFKLRFVDSETSAVIDISSATTKTIKFRKPDGTEVSKTAVFTTDGSDGYIEYPTVTDDLDQLGSWKIQGFASGASFSNHTKILNFEVKANI